MSSVRQFEAADPFGRTWTVDFLWQQNAISIRHADTIDCKFTLSDGPLKEEKVIALPHPLLKALAARLGKNLNDAWVMKLAAAHLRVLIETGEDLEKALVTATAADLDKANQAVDAGRAAAAV